MAAMSAPAEKALSPAPVTTSACTPPSRLSSRMARASSRSVAASRAFSAFGRSRVRVATASARVTCRFWSWGSTIQRLSINQRPRGAPDHAGSISPSRRRRHSRNDSKPARCSRSTGRTSPSTVWGGPAFGFSRVDRKAPFAAAQRSLDDIQRPAEPDGHTRMGARPTLVRASRHPPLLNRGLLRSRAQYSGLRSKQWWASMKRTVRVAERMTTELVTAPPFT